MFYPNTSYYAGIMLVAFSYLLCLKLCWHNRRVPNRNYVSTLLNRYEFEMPTEDLERGSERVEQQEEEPPQIINGTRSLSSLSSLVLPSV